MEKLTEVKEDVVSQPPVVTSSIKDRLALFNKKMEENTAETSPRKSSPRKPPLSPGRSFSFAKKVDQQSDNETKRAPFVAETKSVVVTACIVQDNLAPETASHQAKSSIIIKPSPPEASSSIKDRLAMFNQAKQPTEQITRRGSFSQKSITKEETMKPKLEENKKDQHNQDEDLEVKQDSKLATQPVQTDNGRVEPVNITQDAPATSKVNVGSQMPETKETKDKHLDETTTANSNEVQEKNEVPPKPVSVLSRIKSVEKVSFTANIDKPTVTVKHSAELSIIKTQEEKPVSLNESIIKQDVIQPASLDEQVAPPKQVVENKQVTASETTKESKEIARSNSVRDRFKMFEQKQVSNSNTTIPEKPTFKRTTSNVPSASLPIVTQTENTVDKKEPPPSTSSIRNRFKMFEQQETKPSLPVTSDKPTATTTFKPTETERKQLSPRVKSPPEKQPSEPSIRNKFKMFENAPPTSPNKPPVPKKTNSETSLTEKSRINGSLQDRIGMMGGMNMMGMPPPPRKLSSSETGIDAADEERKVHARLSMLRKPTLKNTNRRSVQDGTNIGDLTQEADVQRESIVSIRLE
ncbi:hypothetical protein AKO1_002286 [Acrasis kona]|uniref:Uncharacterized protein n=1 Tax=Acrasis kona TaxID=1008807 RepID=A0AAW2ZNN1_9EUKA